MLRPSRRQLYVLIAIFLVLALLKVAVGGLLLNLLILVLLIALLIYFVVVTVLDFLRTRD